MNDSHPRSAVFSRRRAGVLLHPTSLPGGQGNGDLGADAYRFIDFLAGSGFTLWQTLPLGPTHEDLSPYQCLSVHAGNYRLISLQSLVERGWLDNAELDAVTDTDAQRKVRLSAAHNGFLRSANEAERDAFETFRKEHRYWLDDYAFYEALRANHNGMAWYEWPAGLRDREHKALKAERRHLAGSIEQICFEQFLFFQQWHALRDYANQRGVLLFGDVPIFVAHDSADVWAHRDLFELDESGQPRVVAGVPPDYFSATGQRWGNPHYRWKRMQEEGFSWWVQRMRSQMEMFDLVRIDHFRGFEAYWEIDAAAETAIHGRWVQAPGEALFTILEKTFGHLPMVAEDLGIITPEVEALRRQFELPGMKILQFAFDGASDNPYLPHNHEACSVVYTGTHDNNTTLGWYQECDQHTRHSLRHYLGDSAESMPWLLVRAALASVAGLAVLPMQDILELDASHRMNMPGIADGNWRWRFQWEQLTEEQCGRLRDWISLYGR